jgi:hypothetical protein
MRRFALIPVAALSLVALISACATSPDEGLGAAVEETKSAEPEPDNSTKLPPKTTTSATDAGTTADSAKPDTGSTTSSSGTSGTSGSSGSSGTSGSSGSSGSSTSSSSSGGVGASCDLSDPLKLIIYQIEVSNQSSPVPCPCAATKCCYLGVTCIDP